MKNIWNGTKKISFRLTMVYGVLFFIALVLVNVATLLSISYYMDQTSAQQLRLIDQAIRKEIHSFRDIKTVDFNSISQISDNVDISLIINNAVVYQTGREYHLPLPNDANISIIKSTEAGDNKILYLNTELVLGDNKVLGIQLVKDMDTERDYLQVLMEIMLVMDAFILFIAILVGYLISKRALKPIDKIINQAKQISASDLSKRIELDGPDDEIKRLADTFNDLIARIEYSYEKQNQFTLDVTHELATPLAVIKGYIDLIDRWAKDDREILDEGILSIKNELSNMTKLLDTLIFISKSDNEIFKIEKTKFWLDEMIMEIIKESKLVSNTHEIYSKINEHISIEADRRLVKQMLRAIIDNSLKYTEKNGSIEIDSRHSNGNAVITVADTGIGIPSKELPYIFDRFYRVDKARSRESGGTGLGLSIVKWIADIHGGYVNAKSEIGKGTTMTISLPLK
ncbi:MAG: ATP-binding protein [Eubacteriales bacterium]